MFLSVKRIKAHFLKCPQESASIKESQKVSGTSAGPLSVLSKSLPQGVHIPPLPKKKNLFKTNLKTTWLSAVLTREDL